MLQNLEHEAPQPEENFLEAEQAVEMHALVAQLDPDYRTPLVLRYWEDYSYEEIAQTMDLTVSAVKSRLFRARKQMADLYEQQRKATPPVSGKRQESAARVEQRQPVEGIFWRTAFAL